VGISLGPVPMMYKTLQRGQMRGLTAADRHQCKGSEENRSHARVRVSNASVLSALACRAPSILANLSSRMVSGARDCRQDRFPLESGWPGHLIGNIALSFLDFGIRARGVCLSRGGKPSLRVAGTNVHRTRSRARRNEGRPTPEEPGARSALRGVAQEDRLTPLILGWPCAPTQNTGVNGRWRRPQTNHGGLALPKAKNRPFLRAAFLFWCRKSWSGAPAALKVLCSAITSTAGECAGWADGIKADAMRVLQPSFAFEFSPCWYYYCVGAVSRRGSILRVRPWSLQNHQTFC